LHYVAVSIQSLQLGIGLVIGFRVRHTVTIGIRNRANHGFRSKHSTETQLLLTMHDMLKNRDQGKQLTLQF